MAKYCFFCYIFVILSGPSYAARLQGIVTDFKTGEPLPGATITIDNVKRGAASGVDGLFSIDNITPGQYGIFVRLIGYKEVRRKVIVNADTLTRINIALEQTPWELDEVVVTATRRKHILKDVPVTTELITRDDMLVTGALTVDQALKSHVGITIEDDLSGKGAVLRGVDPSRVLILIDGHRVIGRVQGSIDLGQISLSDIDRIEIVKGSGSTLYGSDAMGGVVNIITKKPVNSRRLSSSIEYGSFSTFDPEFQLEAARGNYGLLFSGKHEQTDGFDLLKDTPHTNGQEAIKRYNLNTKLGVGLAKSFYNELSLGYMHEKKQWIESEWHEGLQQTLVYDDYEWNDRYDAGTMHRLVVSPRTELEASFHGSYYDHDWSKYTAAGFQNDSSVTNEYIVDGSLQGNHTFAPGLILTSGGDMAKEELESTQISEGKKNVIYGDLYSQIEWSPFTALTFLPGIRWERHQTYGNHYNPSMNLKWAPNDRLAFRAGAGEGFRAPSIKELYFIFDHSAAGYIVYGGGDQLDPEKSRNYSLSAELNYGRRGLHRLTLFRNDLSNLIEFDLIEFTPTYWRGVYRYQNIVKARTQGIEWESKVKILSDWDLSFSYTYLQARNLTEDTDLINRPQHTAKVSSVYAFPRWDAGFTVWGAYNDRKLWTSEGETPERISKTYAPKWMVWNLNLYKRFFKSFEVYFRIENITNEINATYGYWPPRSFTAGLRFNFSHESNDSKE
jgi:outer membrane receptor for ferrienterochelin and colicins